MRPARPARLRTHGPEMTDLDFLRIKGVLARPFGYRPKKPASGITRERWYSARQAARTMTQALRSDATGGFALARLNREHLVDNHGRVYYKHHSGTLIPL